MKKLTKKQIAEQALMQASTEQNEATETIVASIEATPVIDEAPAVDELYVPVKKPMKIVKTVKTGVGSEILQYIANGVLSNKEIVAKVLEDNPLRKTTYACVAWYHSQVKAGKIDLPKANEEVMDEESNFTE